MSTKSGGTKTLAVCDSCGSAFVARETSGGKLVPFGTNGCGCGENELRALN